MVFGTVNRAVLVGAGVIGAALLGVIAWQAYENSQQRDVIDSRNTTIGTLNEQNRTLRQQRDRAQATMALQALQFNRANQISEEARRVRQQSGIRAEQVRRDVHTGISAHTCSRQLLPAADADRLLHYVTELRDDALHPDTRRVDRPNTAFAPTRRLTWGQAVEWIPLLLGDIESCNADKAALRRIDKDKANETAQAH